MLTSKQIADAKKRVRYRYPNDILHEHDDCIRMCHEWLQVQSSVSGMKGPGIAMFRSLIMHWAGSYVSKDDVDVALVFLPTLKVTLHESNISKKLMLPDDRRLKDLGAAMRHPDQRLYLERDMRKTYKRFE